MLFLSTYKVVLHPSYLQKKSSFIIFIKNIQLSDSLRKQPSTWRRAVGGAKKWRALEHRSSKKKKQTFDAISLTVCSSESWPGSFTAETALSFSIKRCVNPASNWDLFIKRSSTNTLEKLHCCPRKTKCIHSLQNTGFVGKLNTVIFPSQSKGNVVYGVWGYL